MNTDDYEDDDEMMWEQHAREAVEEVTEDVEKDDIRGVMYLMSGRDHHFDKIQEEFTDYDSLYHKLTDIAETEWINYAPFDGGEPVFEPSVEDYVDSAIQMLGAEDFFIKNRNPEDTEEIIDSHDLLSPQGAHLFKIDVENINEELIKYFARHPDRLHTLSPRKFEELVAELFKDMGYDVELTLISKDGGFDIRAVRKTGVGCGLTLIECKRYSHRNKVGVEIVRGLYGVVEQERATSGLVVTTSYFTKGAVEYQQDLQYRMALADRDRLQQFMKEYKNAPTIH